jgi:hypothetical protein
MDGEDKMFKNNKHSFWQALIVAIFIFGIGIMFGLFLEQYRADKISQIYLESEINLLDIELQSKLLDVENLDCSNAIEKNILFGDSIYEDAKQLDRYEQASRLKQVLIEQHKRYNLLRTLFWINSIKIKEKCPSEFNTVVYLYNYNPKSIEETNKQKTFSNFLRALKYEYGNKIILIPLAIDLNLTSIDTLTNKYNIQDTSILINEEHLFTDIENLQEIKELLK